MSAYSLVVRWVGYPLFDLIRGRRVSHLYRELKESQWLDPDEIRERQWRRLKKLLAHSYLHVPFYRDRFSQLGITPEDIRTWEDLEELPPLTKEDIRGQRKRLVSDNAQRFRISPGRTGGSTGKPTHFYYSMLSRDYIRAAVMRNIEWAGLRVGERYIKVSGSHFDYTRSRRALVRLVNLLLRQKNIAADNLSREKTRDFINLVRRFEPKALWGYASAVYALARMSQELGVRDIHLDTIITSSDTLFEEQRRTIEETFGCPVFDLYSSREFHTAGECERHEGFHVAAESVLLEVEKGGHSVLDEQGNILITDLHNYGFPFIRYAIGDVGCLTTRRCSCGRGLPLLEYVVGRVEDFIVTPSGRAISPPALTVLLSDVLAVRDYQLVQDRKDSVAVRLVTDEQFSEADLLHIKNGLRQIVGDDVQVAFQFVSEIARGESGKRRVVISRVPQAF